VAGDRIRLGLPRTPPRRAGHAHLTLAVDDIDRWIAGLAGRGITPVRTETVPAGRKLVLADPEGNEIALAEVPL
jgi:predicted enzyme related to lactoylglutathione lyase